LIWPWYVAGPLIGLTVPALLLLGGRLFGISSNLAHLCSAALPKKPAALRYDWRRLGSWNLAFALGIVIGAWISATWMPAVEVDISAKTVAALAELGLGAPAGLVPPELFAVKSLGSFPSLIVLAGGGFLVGFGARYAGGCTSGHAISGLADLQLPSLVAVIAFFVGGLLSTHLLLPWVLQ